MRSTHKYNAIPTVYNGIRYASKAEAAYAERLDVEKAAGGVDWWLPQIKVQLTPDDRYQVDFLVCEVKLPGTPGSYNYTMYPREIHAVEIKGVITAAFNRNKRLWKKYGPFPLRVVRGGKTIEIVEPET